MVALQPGICPMLPSQLKAGLTAANQGATRSQADLSTPCQQMVFEAGAHAAMQGHGHV